VSRREDGALAIVLHTHMPYVEGFGTWPFGEEWLWEAIACCYLPLVALLRAGAPLTLSLTPVLCDQLEAPGVPERFEAFVKDVRRRTHAEDAAGLRGAGEDGLARELERAAGDYELALEQLRALDGDLLSALAPFAHWTSSATHAVLPLLACDAGVRLQLRTGIESHRRRFGAWAGGFWLPECAYEPSLAEDLAEAGVRAVCVELTNRHGAGSAEHLVPRREESGVVLVPIDRATISRVWSEGGYPAAGPYRDYHHHTVHHHNPWCNAGAPYEHEAALALARAHAAEFVAATRERLEAARAQSPDRLPGGGLVVCALDTELLGHWWYEGITWLQAVVAECARQGLELVRLDEALEEIEPSAMPPGDAAGASSWGRAGDLSTWSGPAVAEMAFGARAGELEVLAAGRDAGPAAVRELLALQASDWPFMVSREIAVPYAKERFATHRDALQAALRAGPGAAEEGLRNLAPEAHPGVLLAP
jgi:1,4-alpha-glucan branching enzyme